VNANHGSDLQQVKLECHDCLVSNDGVGMILNLPYVVTLNELNATIQLASAALDMDEGDSISTVFLSLSDHNNDKQMAMISVLRPNSKWATSSYLPIVFMPVISSHDGFNSQEHRMTKR
jgi:hypothetical protein